MEVYTMFNDEERDWEEDEDEEEDEDW